MRVWVDLANSPHVPLLVPVVRQLESDGHEVLLTARDHAQTLELARRQWPAVETVGGQSPPGRLEKGASILRRAEALRRFARSRRPTIAFSHGSYAQLVAARLTGVPAVTMMDYEHQPANHLSFRLARKVIVPEVFPGSALRRCGARPRKVVRYPGFKEDLYLAEFRPDRRVLDELGLDPARVIVVLRPPPEGALYHRQRNEHFDDVAAQAARSAEAQAVLLPRTPQQAKRYAALEKGFLVPERAVDASSLLAVADLTLGGGGTMNRESALLGTPTYTLFTGRLAAVDAELMRLGRMHDLRAAGVRPALVKKPVGTSRAPSKSGVILDMITETIEAVAG